MSSNPTKVLDYNGKVIADAVLTERPRSVFRYEDNEQTAVGGEVITVEDGDKNRFFFLITPKETDSYIVPMTFETEAEMLETISSYLKSRSEAKKESK